MAFKRCDCGKVAVSEGGCAEHSRSERKVYIVRLYGYSNGQRFSVGLEVKASSTVDAHHRAKAAVAEMQVNFCVTKENG